MVRADARAVTRMLINTVGNAIKFTPDGGKRGRVMVQAAAVGGALQFGHARQRAGHSRSRARDAWCQAFERGSGGARAEGTGAWAWRWCARLAALHGGTLSLHEAPGGGALGAECVLPVLAD
jgi:signal transduction histidine kinase